MKPTILSQFLVALVASALLLAGYSYISGAKKNVVIEHVDKSPVQKAVYTLDEAGNPVPLDFVGVAENSVSAVVHIIATSGVNRTNAKEETYIDPFGRKFRMQPRGNQPSVGSGSGVIINNDGYIVTNNHVVTGADDLEVHLNDKRKFKAKLIGTDPQTDIAVIKIDQKDLNSLKFSNSDMVKVGQWVLAIGNPFNLTSTVTAGIVSAKGRNIDINQTLGGIESFIQTDAAINPGNSGGALVDLNGNLIGINTAIASQTGSYAGYGFAVPANIASRVVSDLIQFGSTQRGYLGVTVVSLESPQAKTQGITLTEGALIGSVSENSAAKKAGILANDVVVAINDHKVGTSADLIEFVGSHRIGDEIKVKVNRKGDEKIFTVKLQNDKGTLAAVAPTNTNEDLTALIGADLTSLDKSKADEMGIDGGVVVSNIKEGLFSENDIEEGFVITKVNKKPVKTASDVMEILKSNVDGALIEGYYPGYPQKQYYGIGPK